VHFLSAEDLANGTFEIRRHHHGVRTYAVREDLKAHNGRILDYVKRGGVVIVQYKHSGIRSELWSLSVQYGFQPGKVTDENSKVEILAPSNPVFAWPNKITNRDFDNWVEERGSKFLQSWAASFEPLLETHDPGQAPQKGGLVYAKYGKGVYIYNAYAFYRQCRREFPAHIAFSQHGGAWRRIPSDRYTRNKRIWCH